MNADDAAYNFKKIIPNVAGAINHKGILWTPKPKFFGSILYNTSNYHIADYNLYYMSVRKNAFDRANQYVKQNANEGNQ